MRGREGKTTVTEAGQSRVSVFPGVGGNYGPTHRRPFPEKVCHRQRQGTLCSLSETIQVKMSELGKGNTAHTASELGWEGVSNSSRTGNTSVMYAYEVGQQTLKSIHRGCGKKGLE